MDGLLNIFAQYRPITLEGIKQVRLMNRVDQKYIIARHDLPTLLEALSDKYYMQQIDGEPLAAYRTLYFDTAQLDMYTEHHNKKLHRQKLRIRTYRSTQTTFFEIKDKNNRGRTNKTRIAVDPSQFYTCLDLPEVENFVAKGSRYALQCLLPQLENSFERITLTNYEMTERVTIDLNIHYHNHQTLMDGDLAPIVVIEVKSDAANLSSHIKDQLKSMRLLPRRMSKYCIGTVITNPECKYNRFKDKIRYIERVAGCQINKYKKRQQNKQ